MKTVSGIGEIAGRYEGLFLDIWGVLHNGLVPFPGTVDCLGRLRGAGIKTCLVSNTPSRADDIAGRLAGIGIYRTLYDDIVTAGESAWHGLEKYRGRRCWHFGRENAVFSNRDMAENYNICVSEGPQDADFFINEFFAADGAVPDAALDELKLAADRGLTMICTNPDLIVEIGHDKFICPGTPARLYEEMGGTVDYHGKPHGPVYDWAQELLGVKDKTRLCAVGDSLHTDIQGANRFGIDSVLNLAGIHRQDLAGGGAYALRNMVDAQPHRPTYIINDFQW